MPDPEVRGRLEDPRFTARQRLLVTRESSTSLVRVVARLSPVLDSADGAPLGHLGFFDAVDESEAAAACLRAGVAWLFENSATEVIGPLDSDTWHRYRLNVGPWERRPFPMEPWNPPYYPRLWESAGFVPLETYSSKWIEDVAQVLPHLERSAARSRRRGYTIRPFEPARLEAELDLVHRISLAIFRDNYLYSPTSREEFGRLYAGIERILDPELVVFAADPAGRECGFLFSYADPHLRAVHYKTIGVEPEHRLSGAAAALAEHVYRNARARGLAAGNHALMRESNASQGMDAGHGEVFRRYLLYRFGGNAA